MSPQTMEHDALSGEINERIRDIDRATASKNDSTIAICKAHEPLARGVCTLLRVAHAQLSERQNERREHVEIIWKAAGIAVAVCGVLAGVICALVK